MVNPLPLRKIPKRFRPGDVMQPITFTLQIKGFDDERIDCAISNAAEDNILTFFTRNSAISFQRENKLAANIRNNKHQLKKILASACCKNLKIGQYIDCVLIENFTFLQKEDFKKFIRMDRRNHRLTLSISPTGFTGTKKIYGDGSFMRETGQAGYGGFIETPDGARELFSSSVRGSSNNAMELLAITEGLHRLRSEEVIQINTDSRFVIRGLTQWVHFWKHNNWQSAYGRDVRYTPCWQEADRLCDGKYIEFRWIKAHSGDEKQEFCHQLAKHQSTRPRR